MTLLQMSFSGGIMILVIAGMRILAVHRLPKRTFVLLWGAVLLRLLLPFSIPSAFSVYSLMYQNAAGQEPLSYGKSGNTVFQPGTVQFSVNAGVAQRVQNDLPRISWWTAVWMAGMILCVAFLLASYLHWYREFRTSMPVDSEPASKWLREHPLRRPVRIRQSGRIYAPLTYGVLHPVILIPKDVDWEDERQMEWVLLHEYMHICHCDVVLKMAAALALCVHWFNPAVWLMYVLLNRDIELACDESVVRQLGDGAKAGYARTLILLEEQKSGPVSLCSHFSKNATEERIVALMKAKKVTLGAVGGSAAVLIGVIIFFASSPTEKTGQEPFFMTDTGEQSGGPAYNMTDTGDQSGQSYFNRAYPGEQSGQEPFRMAGSAEQGEQAPPGSRDPADRKGQPDSHMANLPLQGSRMLFCNGQIYLSTQQDVSEMVAREAAVSELDSPYIGVVSSSVEPSEIPEQELQSNFGCEGAEIVFNGSGIAVNIDGRWIQFLPGGIGGLAATGLDDLVTGLMSSIFYRSGSFYFTIPESGSGWHILINGRYEADGLGGMSTHFLQEMAESSEWVGGETYSFPADAAVLAELYMVVSIGEESEVIDLMGFLPENASQLPVEVALNQ